MRCSGCCIERVRDKRWQEVTTIPETPDHGLERSCLVIMCGDQKVGCLNWILEGRQLLGSV